MIYKNILNHFKFVLKKSVFIINFNKEFYNIFCKLKLFVYYKKKPKQIFFGSMISLYIFK